MVDHLQHAALQALLGQAEDADDDEAEVGDRRVRHQPLEVLLHGGHQGPVDDPDHAQGEEHRGQVDRRRREQVEPEAHEPVGAQLQQDAGQDHRAAGGRLGVGVGQPRVHREDGALDGEGGGEGQEQPAGGVLRHRLALGQADQVEGEVAGGLLAEEHQGQDADQHQGRAEHRVDEELEGGVDPPLVAPPADEEVHGDEHDLPEQEEHEQVEGQEHPDAARLQQEHPRHVALEVVVDVGPGDGQREEDAAEDHQEEGDPVDAQLPGDAERLDPRVVGDELEAAVAGVEVEEQDQAEQAHQQGDAEADPGHHVVAVLGQEGHQARAQGRDQDQQGEDGDVVAHQLGATRATGPGRRRGWRPRPRRRPGRSCGRSRTGPPAGGCRRPGPGRPPR